MTHLSTSEINGQAGVRMPTGLKVLTGAGAILCAAHRGRNYNMHGHTWEITAWWLASPDAVERQETLISYLSEYDHAPLPDAMTTAEGMAQRIMEDLGCVKVEISRPLERLYAVVEMTHPTPDSRTTDGEASYG